MLTCDRVGKLGKRGGFVRCECWMNIRQDGKKMVVEVSCFVVDVCVSYLCKVYTNYVVN